MVLASDPRSVRSPEMTGVHGWRQVGKEGVREVCVCLGGQGCGGVMVHS